MAEITPPAEFEKLLVEMLSGALRTKSVDTAEIRAKALAQAIITRMRREGLSVVRNEHERPGANLASMSASGNA